MRQRLRYPADGRPRHLRRGPNARPRGIPGGHARLAEPPAHGPGVRASRRGRRSRGRDRGADRVRGRRRARPAGVGRRAGGGGSTAPGRGGIRRTDPAALRGARAAGVRARGPADHRARPRAGGASGVPGRSRAGPPPKPGRLRPRGPLASRVPPRPRRPLHRPAARDRAWGDTGAARARGLLLAHRAPSVSAGSDHGRPRSRPLDGGTAPAMTPERPDAAPSDPGSPVPATPDPASFLSGDAGDVTHPWRRAKRVAGEFAFEAIDILAGTRRAAGRLAQNTAPRDILVTGVYRPGSQLTAALPALRSEKHNVRLAFGATGGGGGGRG